jgi:hypothetical protein
LLQIATGDKQTGMNNLKILASEEQKNGKLFSKPYFPDLVTVENQAKMDRQ